MIRQPTLRQLHYLDALARAGHFGRAAAAANITQSTLSAAIKDLEETLGVALVDRGKRRVVFTPAGQEVLKRGRRLLEDADELVAAAAAARAPLSGLLRLGVIPTIGPFLLPKVLPRLRRAFPKLKLVLVEDQTARIVDQLGTGALDVLLLALPCDCGTAETMELFEDEFLATMPKAHALASEAEVPPAYLAEEPLLLLQEGHCLRSHALSVCNFADPALGPVVEATSLHTLVQMADGGLGVTLLPRLAVDAGILRGTNLAARPLDADPRSRTIGLAWRRGTGRRNDFELLGRTVAELQREKSGSAIRKSQRSSQ
ncbi:MAG: hydrogen peroxide-inducible genes activator [Alphaproteobacteria bacterium]|nr:hydrogen peroxide-inducible genes activator [Alphaproteobacteria bacterium]